MCASWISRRSGRGRWQPRYWLPSAPTSSRSKGCADPTECGSRAAVHPAGTSGGNGARSSCAATPTSARSASSSARPKVERSALDLIAHGDLVIENFSPRVMANFHLEWDAVHAANPKATMIRMPAFGLDGPWRDRVGFAQTMEQASGMAWMTGPADGPPLIPRGACDPLAGLHAAFAAIAALEIRDRTGTGLHVESTMVEAALNVAAEAVLEYSLERHRDAPQRKSRTRCQPTGRVPVRGRRRVGGPRGARRRRVARTGQVDRPCRAGDGPDAAPTKRAAASGRRDRQAHRRLDGSAWRRRRRREPARARDRRRAGHHPRPKLLDDEQLAARSFWEFVDHPRRREVQDHRPAVHLRESSASAGSPRPPRYTASTPTKC